MSGMFSLADTARIGRAIATNQIARLAPAIYVRLTGQTGRGSAAEESPDDIAKYFRNCADEYFQKLGIRASETSAFLAGKTLMEYGPGDLPGVALFMVALGAEKVYCVDRFPLMNLSNRNARVLRQLIESSEGVERDRLLTCLADKNDARAGFDPRRVEYLVRPSGLSGLHEAVDLVFSRAVLEHVNDLDATFADMTMAMRSGATAIHLVDLRSHGLHKLNPLDFLQWSPALWRLMYSEKGVPNRWRIDKYRSVLEGLPVEIGLFAATEAANSENVALVRPCLADIFRHLSDDDLRCLGFWLLFRKRAN